MVLTQKQTPLCGGQTGQKSKANLLASEASSTTVVDIQLDPLAKLWTSPGTYQSIDMFLTPAEITHNGQKRFKNVAENFETVEFFNVIHSGPENF